jgi:hypothetical protein
MVDEWIGRQGRKVELTKDRACRNGANGALTIAEVGRDGERALLADAHVEKTLVPAVCDGLVNRVHVAVLELP